jgi:transposase
VRPCPPERWREYLNGILYVLRTGCAWRHLPHDFTVGWSAAHKPFLRRCRAGTWTEGAHSDTRRGPYPVRSTKTAHGGRGGFILIKASPVTGPRGFDGAKKVDGVKRHVLVDSAGVLVAAVVTTADAQDRAAFRRLLRTAKRVAPTITHVWVDNGYTGSTVADAAAKARVHVDVVCGPKPGHGFIVELRRGVVEHTNGWTNHCRRLDRHYEVTFAPHEGFLVLGQIALLL